MSWSMIWGCLRMQNLEGFCKKDTQPEWSDTWCIFHTACREQFWKCCYSLTFISGGAGSGAVKQVKNQPNSYVVRMVRGSAPMFISSALLLTHSSGAPPPPPPLNKDVEHQHHPVQGKCSCQTHAYYIKYYTGHWIWGFFLSFWWFSVYPNKLSLNTRGCCSYYLPKIGGREKGNQIITVWVNSRLVSS